MGMVSVQGHTQSWLGAQRKFVQKIFHQSSVTSVVLETYFCAFDTFQKLFKRSKNL